MAWRRVLHCFRSLFFGFCNSFDSKHYEISNKFVQKHLVTRYIRLNEEIVWRWTDECNRYLLKFSPCIAMKDNIYWFVCVCVFVVSIVIIFCFAHAFRPRKRFWSQQHLAAIQEMKKIGANMSLLVVDIREYVSSCRIVSEYVLWWFRQRARACASACFFSVLVSSSSSIVSFRSSVSSFFPSISLTLFAIVVS